MAMNVGTSEGDEDEAISAINTTPLVDVMLVLLIIFLITIPVVTQSVGVKLPEETNVARQTKPENIEVAVTKDGDVYWGMQLVRDNEELVNRLKKIATQQPQPEVHIRGDQAGRYEFVGRVVFAAQRAGIQKVGFVTEPPAKNAGGR
jgi:biopolymer transport protein ExbD